MKCPHCGSYKIQKNGHYKNVQRYKCLNPKCNKSFRDKNYYFKSKIEKDFVQALYNLINQKHEKEHFTKVNITKLFSNSKNETNIELIRIRKAKEDTSKIQCQNPKAILCECGNEIRILLLPNTYKPKQFQYRQISFNLFDTPDQIYTVNGIEVKEEY